MKYLLILTYILLFLPGCAKYTLANSETLNGANLHDYPYYRVVSCNGRQLPAGMHQSTYSNIVAAIHQQMHRRGFIEHPDAVILINVGVTIKETLTPQDSINSTHPATAGVYISGCYPEFILDRDSYWTDCYTYTRVIKEIYNEGVLTIDMIDTRRMKPVFSSSVSSIIDPVNGCYHDRQDIDEAVEVMFSHFPVPLMEAALH